MTSPEPVTTLLGDFPPEAIAAGAQALRKAALLDNAGYIDGDEERAAQAVLEAAAAHLATAERERCAQLAEVKRAVYCKPCDGAPCDYDDELAPFAALLREQP